MLSSQIKFIPEKSDRTLYKWYEIQDLPGLYKFEDSENYCHSRIIVLEGGQCIFLSEDGYFESAFEKDYKEEKFTRSFETVSFTLDFSQPVNL